MEYCMLYKLRPIDLQQNKIDLPEVGVLDFFIVVESGSSAFRFLDSFFSGCGENKVTVIQYVHWGLLIGVVHWLKWYLAGSTYLLSLQSQL